MPASVQAQRGRTPKRIEKLAQLSSSYREGNLSISSDGLLMIFSSMRYSDAFWKQRYTFNGYQGYDSDLYYSTRASTTQPWSPPKALPVGLNTEYAEMTPHFVQGDRTTLIFSRITYDMEEERGPIYQATMDLAINMIKKGPLIPYPTYSPFADFFRENGFTHVDGLTVLSNGSLLLCASTTDTDNMDIYYCEKVGYDGRTRYLTPKKLPEPINSAANERSVFYDAEAELLYFSSDRPVKHASGKSLNIYSYPINHRDEFPPTGLVFYDSLNTEADESAFVPASPSEAYLIREGDIHLVTF